MWFTFLASVLSDQVDDRARRRTTHELRQRTGIGVGPEHRSTLPVAPAGPVGIRLWVIDRLIGAMRESGAKTLLRPGVVDRWIDALVDAVEGGLGRMGMMQGTMALSVLAKLEGFPNLRAWADNVKPSDEAPTLNVPWGLFTRIERGQGLDPTPHPFDPLLAWVYDQVLVGESGRPGLFDLIRRPPDRPFPVALSSLVSIAIGENGPSLVDWWEQTHPDLRAFTLSGALRASERWHRQAQEARERAARSLSGLSFGSPIPPGAEVILRWVDGWSLVRLRTKADFAAEGIAMGHCVGGEASEGALPDGDSRYWRAERDGTGMVLSLRDARQIPTATVQVSFANPFSPRTTEPGQVPDSIAQVQGPRDGPVDDEARLRLLAALDRLGVPVLDGADPEAPTWAALGAQASQRLSRLERVLTREGVERLGPGLAQMEEGRRALLGGDLSGVYDITHGLGALRIGGNTGLWQSVSEADALAQSYVFMRKVQLARYLNDRMFGHDGRRPMTLLLEYLSDWLGGEGFIDRRVIASTGCVQARTNEGGRVEVGLRGVLPDEGANALDKLRLTSDSIRVSSGLPLLVDGTEVGSYGLVTARDRVSRNPVFVQAHANPAWSASYPSYDRKGPGPHLTPFVEGDLFTVVLEVFGTSILPDYAVPLPLDRPLSTVWAPRPRS